MSYSYTYRDSVIEYKGKLYCVHKNKVYVYDEKPITWTEVPLPDGLELKNGGIYIVTDIPLKHNTTKHCICLSEDLFRKGCACGGN